MNIFICFYSFKIVQTVFQIIKKFLTDFIYIFSRRQKENFSISNLASLFTYFKLFSIQESIKILELKNFENNGNNISEFIHDIFDFL